MELQNNFRNRRQAFISARNLQETQKKAPTAKIDPMIYLRLPPPRVMIIAAQGIRAEMIKKEHETYG